MWYKRSEKSSAEMNASNTSLDNLVNVFRNRSNYISQRCQLGQKVRRLTWPFVQWPLCVRACACVCVRVCVRACVYVCACLCVC